MLQSRETGTDLTCCMKCECGVSFRESFGFLSLTDEAYILVTCEYL